MESVEYLGFLIEVFSHEAGTYEYSVFDMAGEDKPEFSVFETDGVEFVSYKAAVDAAKSWIYDFLFNDENCAIEHIEKLYATKKALSSSPSMETTGRALPKLTAEVFDNPDCPEWAKWAAVTSEGNGIYLSDKPYPDDIAGVWHGAEHWAFIKAETGGTLKFNAPDWRNSLIERPVFQKLTSDVFNRPDCPEWVNYAAVNADGKVVLFSDKPFLRGAGWVVTFDRTSVQADLLDAVRFDASDWRNSLIERPAKLPDWCKVGEWVFADPEKLFGPAGYKKIKTTDGLELTFEDGCCVYFSDNIKQARLRPYNAEEMLGLVGKVIEVGEFAQLVLMYDGKDNAILAGDGDWLSESTLLKDYTIDGKPCGKLVHKEGDDWVE